MTPEQIKARLETLDKYEWVFNTFLKSGEYSNRPLEELHDINENHREIFGVYGDMCCNDSRARLLRAVAEWYFENKSKYINT